MLLSLIKIPFFTDLAKLAAKKRNYDETETFGKARVYPKETKNWIWEVSKEKAKQHTPTEITECDKRYILRKKDSHLIRLDCKRVEPDTYEKHDSFYCFKNWHNKIPVGATWGHRPHNFLAVGAIAAMESAPMIIQTYNHLQSTNKEK